MTSPVYRLDIRTVLKNKTIQNASAGFDYVSGQYQPHNNIRMSLDMFVVYLTVWYTVCNKSQISFPFFGII